VVEPVVEKLAQHIVEVIIELNGGKAPKTVFCIGGGAQTPLLSEKIAQRLQLPESRVAVRGRDILRQVIKVKHDRIAGPEGVTVLGIASVALKRAGYDFITITVNGQEHSLFNTNNLTVANTLGMIAFNLRHLLASNGRNLTFRLNGRDKTLYGQLGQPAEIVVNEQPANLQTPVQDGDVLAIKQAVAGKDAQLNIEKLVLSQGMVWQSCTVKVNGENCVPTYTIENGDDIEITAVAETPEKKEKQPNTTKQEQKWITVTINGEPVTLHNVDNPVFLDIFNFIELDLTQAKGLVVLKLNGQGVEYTQPLTDGDVIEIYWPENQQTNV